MLKGNNGVPGLQTSVVQLLKLTDTSDWGVLDVKLIAQRNEDNTLTIRIALVGAKVSSVAGQLQQMTALLAPIFQASCDELAKMLELGEAQQKAQETKIIV